MKSIPLAAPRWENCCPDLEKVLVPSFFKALCDPSRASILCRLAGLGKACTVSEIAACCPRDISVVSRHLAILKEAGIVTAEKRGKEVHYQVEGAHVAKTLHRLADALAGCCATNEEKKE